MPHATLKSVADLAGVSLSTASRALAGNPRLLPTTIATVRAVAKKVGYHANPFISDAMRRVRSRDRVGHLAALAYLTFHDTATGWQQNPTYLRFHEGALARARALGFSLDVIWAREPRLKPRRLTAILLARGIAGVVIGPRPTQPTADVLDWSQFSAASVGVPLPGVHLHQAGSHHARLMQHLLAALHEKGYRRPGLVLLETQISRTDPGWVAMWTYRQQALPPRDRVPLLTLPVLQQKAVARWLERHAPDVVIGVESALVSILERTGRRVPHDIGFAHLSRPEAPDAPAGMDQLPRDIGGAAVELIANQIFAAERGLPASPRVLLVEAQWQDGWTVRAR